VVVVGAPSIESGAGVGIEKTHAFVPAVPIRRPSSPAHVDEPQVDGDTNPEHGNDGDGCVDDAGETPDGEVR
jgi:hypothetical protein